MEKRDSIRSVNAKLLRSSPLTPRLWTPSAIGLRNWDSLPTESTLQTPTTTGTNSNTETVSISAWVKTSATSVQAAVEKWNNTGMVSTTSGERKMKARFLEEVKALLQPIPQENVNLA
jgi:hypothetical protein